MQGLLKSAIVARFLNSNQLIGFSKNSSRERYASYFYNKTFSLSYDENVIKRNFELVKFALDLPFDFKNIRNKSAFIFSEKKYKVADISSNKKNILLIPGASYAAKQYPVENFAELIDLFDANYLITWGNNQEKSFAIKIKELAPKVNICDKLSINNLISLVSQVDLIIGPDTGPTHMGWASNIPSITLFGPTPGYRNTISTNVNKIIESQSDVNPKKIDINDYSIKDINVCEIVKMIQNLLVKSS
jgi:heptosyltransferase-1